MKGSIVKNVLVSASAFYALVLSTTTFAIPTLQVGAPAGSGDTGSYADIIGSTSDPDEHDTAITSGGSIIFAAAYDTNDLLIGGKYSTGLDWSGISYGKVNGIDQYFNTAFNSKGAVAMVTAKGTGSITLGGNSSFYSTTTNLFPNNHAPLGEPGVNFLFFDLGNFLKSNATIDGVTNFATETDTGYGLMKTLNLITSGYDWLHFDMMALVTDPQGKTNLKTTLDGNPGSHDVTWQPSQEVPEPGSLALLGLGLLGFGLSRRKRSV